MQIFKNLTGLQDIADNKIYHLYVIKITHLYNIVNNILKILKSKPNLNNPFTSKTS